MSSARRRHTRQRSAIVSTLRATDSFLSAQELYEELRRAGENIGLTTVYRNLRAMSDSGDVDVVRRDDGEAIYRACRSNEHHHHLVCRSCSFSVEVDDESLETWADAVGRAHGFNQLSHDVEIFGLCPNCSA